MRLCRCETALACCSHLNWERKHATSSKCLLARKRPEVNGIASHLKPRRELGSSSATPEKSTCCNSCKADITFINLVEIIEVKSYDLQKPEIGKAKLFLRSSHRAHRSAEGPTLVLSISSLGELWLHANRKYRKPGPNDFCVFQWNNENLKDLSEII